MPVWKQCKGKFKEADVYFIVVEIFMWDENSVGWNLLFWDSSVNKIQNIEDSFIIVRYNLLTPFQYQWGLQGDLMIGMTIYITCTCPRLCFFWKSPRLTSK